MKLSVIVIAQDESAVIRRCLESVAWADERIVVDSGSSDDTVRIARDCGARVESTTDWPGFGPQKNRALALARGDWVLALDADEWVTPRLRAELEQAMARAGTRAAWRMPRRSSFCGRFMRHSGWWPDYVVRLFRRGSARFSDDLVHERLLVEGAVGTLRTPLLHESMRDLDEVLSKLNAYSAAGAEMLHRRGARTSLLAAVLHGSWSFFRTYLLRLGILDGRAGFVLAVANAESSYYRYVKLLLRDAGSALPDAELRSRGPVTRSADPSPARIAHAVRGSVATPTAVVISTYNRPDALALVLEGYLAQSTREFSLIVADDGSTDETRQVVARYAARAPIRIAHVWQEDRGFRPAAIRNLAVASTDADYIVFSDGDCIPSHQFVEQHQRLAERGWFLAGNRVLLGEAFTRRALAERMPLHEWTNVQWIAAWARRDVNRLLPLVTLPDGALRRRWPRRWEGVKTCNMSVWRDDLVRVNGLDESYAGWGLEDSDLVVRLLRAGVRHKTARFSAPLFHLWHPDSDRTGLAENQRRLEAVLRSDRIPAAFGLDRYRSDPRTGTARPAPAATPVGVLEREGRVLPSA